MYERLTRRGFLAAAGATALAGCLGTGDGAGPGGDAGSGSGDGPPTADETLPLPRDPDALTDRVVSGGPPRDGIPSIDDPSFVDASTAAAWLDPGDPVFGLARGERTRAYPQSILVNHEICNDVVDGQPVSVTYCPLTGTAMGFERGETTFGVSGRLVNNNLVMYDRATERFWPQILATSIPGPWNADPPVESLREFRVVWTTFERWREAHPGTQVLSRDTGYAKNYDRDPYGAYNPPRGYYEPDSMPLFHAFSDDDRLPPKAVVIGARTTDGAVAFEKDALRAEQLRWGTLGRTTALAVYDPTLDTGYVYLNPEELSFEHRDDRVVSEAGESYPPAELPLERVYAFDAMWFAWHGFYPETSLHV